MATKANDRNRTKFTLDEKDIPTKWYNIQADFKTPAPPVLHPGTKQPIGPQDLGPPFPWGPIKPGGRPGGRGPTPCVRAGRGGACTWRRLTRGRARGSRAAVAGSS